MFKKLESLKLLEKLGLNVFEHFVPQSYQDLYAKVKEWGICGIRTDHRDRLLALPLFILNATEVEDSELQPQLEEIWKLHTLYKYELLVNDIPQYYHRLIYSMILILDRKGNFRADLTERESIRSMEVPLYCEGNTFLEVSDWSIFFKGHNLCRQLADIRRDINDIYFQICEKGLCNKILEIHVFNMPLGKKQEKIVFLQILNNDEGIKLINIGEHEFF